ncbi:MAG: S24 family peptidase, partial [Oscillospiraceae bacterium]
FSVTVDYLLGCDAKAVTSSGEYPIPIIGTVKAGFGALAFEEDYGVEYANVKDPDNYFFLIVKGDSMEPRIQDGDLALVHRQQTLENGELGVMVYGEGDGTLKKFIKRGNAIILQPFNPSYEPQIIKGEDLNSLYIAGKVVETKAKW